MATTASDALAALAHVLVSAGVDVDQSNRSPAYNYGRAWVQLDEYALEADGGLGFTVIAAVTQGDALAPLVDTVWNAIGESDGFTPVALTTAYSSVPFGGRDMKPGDVASITVVSCYRLGA